LTPVRRDQSTVTMWWRNGRRRQGARAFAYECATACRWTADHPGLKLRFRCRRQTWFACHLLCWGILDKGLPHIQRHRDTVIVIDHLGLLQPARPPSRDVLGRSSQAARLGSIRERKGEDQRCLHDVAPTVSHTTISGAGTGVIDAFGLDRCMWGTDWTRTIGMLTYEQGVTPFPRHQRLSEKRQSKRSWRKRCRKSTSGSATLPIRPRYNLTE